MMLKNKAIKLLAAFSALTIGLTACSSATEKPADSQKKDSGKPAKTSELVIYSNTVQDGRDAWLTEKAKAMGIDLKFVKVPGGEVYNRLVAEKKAPQADIALGMDEGYFTKLADQGLLEKYEPKWLKDIPKEYVQGNGLFSPVLEVRIYLMYNPKYIKDAPKDWDDLINNEKFVKKYRLSQAISGGTDQKAAMSILLKYRDDKSKNGISDEGWNQLKKFYEHGYMPPKGEDYVKNFATGKVPIMYFFSTAVPKSEKKFDFKAVPINPKEGVFSVCEQIGIVNKGKDHDYSKAKQFVDWFGSAEAQKEWTAKFGTFPVNPKAQEAADPRLQEIMKATKPMKVDWKFINQHIDEWVEKVELEILK